MTAASSLQHCATPTKAGCLYKIAFPNGKAYIGITGRTAEERFAEHVAYSKNGKKKAAVHLALAKYGAQNVILETLAIESDWTRLQQMEVEAIGKYGTRPPHGYNLTRGGDGVVGFDEVTRAKMGAKNKGRTHDAETRERIRLASTGRRHDEQARAKISAGRKGIKFSDEHRANLRDAHLAYFAAKRGGTARPPVKKTQRTSEEIAAKRAACLALGNGPEARAKVGDALRGRKRPPEVMAKAAATRRANRLKLIEAEGHVSGPAFWSGRKHSEDSIERMRASQRARERTPEEKAAQAEAMRRPEVRAKLAAAASGRKQSPETIAKRVAKTKGQKRSPETRERMRLAQLGKKASADTKARIGRASASRQHSEETKSRIAEAVSAYWANRKRA